MYRYRYIVYTCTCTCTCIYMLVTTLAHIHVHVHIHVYVHVHVVPTHINYMYMYMYMHMHMYTYMYVLNGRSPTFLMSSRLNISGDSPPCTQRNCWFMTAARGRQSKDSMQASYTASEYFILPAVVGRAVECMYTHVLHVNVHVHVFCTAFCIAYSYSVLHVFC